MVAWNLCVPSPQRRPAGAAHAARYPPTGWRKQKVAFTFRLTTPLVKLADLRAKHAGQTNWTEIVVKDPKDQAEYKSAVPGTKFQRRLHPDTGAHRGSNAECWGAARGRGTQFGSYWESKRCACE